MNKFPLSHRSTLLHHGRYDADLDHLRRRAERAGYDIGRDGLCWNCGAAYTEADLEGGECTQCEAAMELIND